MKQRNSYGSNISSRLVLPKLSNSHTRSADMSPSIQKINEIIKIDRLKDRMITKNNTRDVSHIQDPIQRINLKEKPDDFMSGLYNCTYSMPTDLEHLRNILNSTDEYGIPVTISKLGYAELLHCKKRTCVDRATVSKNKHKPQTGSPKKLKLPETDSFLEKLFRTDSNKTPESARKRVIFLGNPTGRQEVENLREWLTVMKEVHLKDADITLDSEEEMKTDTIEAGYIIYNVIIKELIRQVSVQCIERGELLKESIDSLSKYWKKSIQSYILAVNNQKDRHALEIADIKYAHAKQTAKYQIKINQVNITQISEELERTKRSEEKHMKDVEFLRNLVMELKKNHRRKISDMLGQEVDNVAQANQMGGSMPVMSYYSSNTKRVIRGNGEFLSPPLEDNLQSQEEEMLLNGMETIPFRPSLEADMAMDDSSSCISMSEYDQREEKQDKITQTECGDEGGENEEQALQENLGKNEMNLIALEFENAGFAFYIPQSSSIEEEKSIVDQESNNTELQPLDSQNIDQNYLSDSDISEPQPLISFDLSQKEYMNIGITVKLEDEPSTKLYFNKDAPGSSHRNIRIKSLPSSMNSRSLSVISKDKSDYGPDEIIIEEIAHKQEVLNDVSIKLKQAKQTIKGLETEITEKTSELAFLNTEISFCKDDLDSLQHLEAPGNSLSKPKKRAFKSLRSRTPNKKDEIITHIKYDMNLTKHDLDSSNAKQNEGLTSSSDLQLISSQQTKQGIEILISDFDKSVSHLDLIPPTADTISWRAGFNTGFETGKIEGIAMGEEIGMDKGISEGYRKALLERNTKDRLNLSIDNQSYLDRSNLDSEGRTCSDYEDFRSRSDSEDQTQNELHIRTRGRYDSNSSRQDFDFSGKQLQSRGTKFNEFAFKRETHARKVNPAKKILAKFLARNQSVINRYASLGIHMVLRIISLVYISTLSKMKSSEAIDSFLEILYEELLHKYGMKSVAEKKFRETIASMLYHSSFKRVNMLLRLAGVGKRVGMNSYSYLSCKLYMDLLNFMQNFNVGIMVSTDDIAEIQLYPTVRAIECVKEKLEPILDKTAVNSFIRFIEQKSVSDPKRINKSGLIELELFLEKALDLYEEYQESIQAGLIIAMNHMYSEQVSNLLKSDALNLIKNISPNKLPAAQKLIDIELIEIVHFGRAEYECETTASNSISITNFKHICVLNNCLGIREVQAYLQVESIGNLKENTEE